MHLHSAYLVLAALCLPTLAACGNQDQMPAGSAAVERIIAKEKRSAQKPDESRGVEIHAAGTDRIFAGTAMQYGATFKDGNLIDLELIAHRLEGQQMLASGAKLHNLPFATGVVSVELKQDDSTPRMTLTGVPGHDGVSMRMAQGTVTMVSLDHQKEEFTGLPVVQRFAVTFDGQFVPDDASSTIENAADNRGVQISGAVRYHKE